MVPQDAELAAYLSRMYAMFNTGDVSGVDDLVSRDANALGIGTDPREWWVGDAVHQSFQNQPPEMHAAGLRFEPGDAHICREDSIAWIADQPVLKLPDGGDVPMRLTLVCHQEEGDWKMMHFHLSVGTANEETIDEELTI